MKAISLIIIAVLTVSGHVQFQMKDVCIEGVKMLTRIKEPNGNYSLKHVCICPIDYWGEQCRYHRAIKCYLTPKSITPSQITPENYKQGQNVTVSLQTNLECYIAESQKHYILIPMYLLRQQLTQQKLQYSLQNLEKGAEVVWANNTQIFNTDGEVKYNEGYNYSFENGQKKMSKEDQQKIMLGSGPVRFEYKDNFLGFPLSDSQFYQRIVILRPTQNKIVYENQKIKIQNILEYLTWFNSSSYSKEDFKSMAQGSTLEDPLNDPSQVEQLNKRLNGLKDKASQMSEPQLLPYFKTVIQVDVRQAVEFHTIRIQIGIREAYMIKLYVGETGVNALQYFLPVKVQGVGDAQVYSITFNQKTIPRYVYILGSVIFFGLVYLIYSWRQRKQRQKDDRIKKNIEEMDEDLSWK